MKTIHALQLGAALILALVANQSSAQWGQDAPQSAITAPGSFRLLADFDLGIAGGSAIRRDGNTLFEGDLGTTLGMRLQGQASIGSMFYAGVDLGVDGYIGSNVPDGTDRLIVLGVGAAFGFRYMIDLGAIGLEPTIGATLGLAIGTADNVALEDTELGFGFGVRGGATAWFTPMIGAQLNLGYQAHYFFVDAGGGDTATLRLQQFRMGIGAILRFGA